MASPAPELRPLRAVPDLEQQADAAPDQAPASTRRVQIAASTDANGFYSETFNEQFVSADVADVACSDCLPVAQTANGVGLAALADWLRAATAALQAGKVTAVLPPQGSPTEDGVVFVECTSCQLRHHTTWKRKGASTRFLLGKAGGDVYQGQSTYQPALTFAADRTRHYLEHNRALLAGEVE
jgi:hypothetical protein